MRLVVVPLWLKELMHDENIAFSKATCFETIAPHLGSNDLFNYQLQSYLLEDFFKQRYGASFQRTACETHPRDRQLTFHSSIMDLPEGYLTHVTTDLGVVDTPTPSDLDVMNFLTGSTTECGVRFIPQMLENASDGEEQLGLFVEVLGDTSDAHLMKVLRSSEIHHICKTLYAHNFTLKDLRVSGLLGTLFNSNSLIV